MDMLLSFWNFFWILVFLFAPAGVANIFASLSRHTNFPNTPINKDVFGENKTWRGFVFGFVGSVLCVEQFYILNIDGIVNYGSMNFYSGVWFAFLSSFGALGGDLLKSYFKRKKKIEPGISWRPWDQIDWILGVNLAIFLYGDYQVSIINLSYNGFVLSISSFFVVIPISVSLAIPIHMAFNQGAFYVKLQKNKL